MQELETYEHLCTVNKYLFAEMENCTVMIKYLEGIDMDTTELKMKRHRLKCLVNTNLDKLEIILMARNL